MTRLALPDKPTLGRKLRRPAAPMSSGSVRVSSPAASSTFIVTSTGLSRYWVDAAARSTLASFDLAYNLMRAKPVERV